MNKTLDKQSMELEREVACFHNHFFRETLHRDVVNRYIAANQLCLPEQDARAASMIEKIVSNGLDVEAIEYALRLKNRDNILTKKIQILFYLVEVRSRYFPYFFNCNRTILRAITSILFSVPLTAYILCKGNFLIWRYDLV